MMKAVLWHSASCARATHGRTQTNKTTTMIPISTPAIARITTSRVPSSLVIVSFTFEVQGSGERRGGGRACCIASAISERTFMQLANYLRVTETN
jgi:hypothetical protein